MYGPGAATDPLTAARRGLGKVWRKSKAALGIGRDAPVILMYHRVARPDCDPWALCVDPANFADQLGVLREHRTVLSLDALVDAVEGGTVPPRATALTFDDGYADNALTARPMLEAAGLPATFFLTSGFVGGGQPFWWDELADLVLLTRAAADFDLEAGGVRLQGRWPAQGDPPTDLAYWRTGDPTDDPRRRAYDELWRSLHPLNQTLRDRAMAALRVNIGQGEMALAAEARPMSLAEARLLPRASIGGHGRTHVPLTALPRKEKEAEIGGGRADLAQLNGGQLPTGFAYPHGNLDQEARELVVGAGYRWAVTTREAKVNPSRYDPYRLPRIAVGNWDGERLLRTIDSAVP